MLFKQGSPKFGSGHSTSINMKKDIGQLLKKRFLAYCDILGYGNWIDGKTIVEELKYNEEINSGGNIIGNKSLKDLQCNVIHISDTHIFYTSGNNQNDEFGLLIKTIFQFIYYMAINFDLPVRIGISYGEFLYDEKENIMIGAALREACRLEGAQNWMGCSFSNKSANVIENLEGYQTLIENGTLIKYPVPLKKRKSEEMIVLNYDSYRNDIVVDLPINFHDKEYIRKLFRITSLDESDGPIREKYQETIKFIDFIKKKRRDKRGLP